MMSAMWRAGYVEIFPVYAPDIHRFRTVDMVKAYFLLESTYILAILEKSNVAQVSLITNIDLSVQYYC